MTRRKADDLPPGCTGVIYGLRDVGQTDLRYVGLTTMRPQERMWAHWSAARRGQKGGVYRWLAKRLNAQHRIEMVVLEAVMTDKDDLGAAEMRWIAELRAQGHRLLNITAGGGGLVHVPWSDERRRAHSELMTGYKHTDETRALMSSQRKGKRMGAAAMNYGKFGADHPAFGSVRSAETRAILSEQKRGERNPNYGKSPSEETRAKQSATTKGIPRPKSIRNAHTRHHTNKGVVKDGCRHCADDQAVEAVATVGPRA